MYYWGFVILWLFFNWFLLNIFDKLDNQLFITLELKHNSNISKYSADLVEVLWLMPEV